MTTPLDYASFESAFGWVGVAQSDRGLARITFGSATQTDAEDRLFEGIEARRGEAQDAADSRFADAAHLFSRYFDGEAVDFNLDLDLEIGTPFQTLVWEATRRISYGAVQSYGWLAREVGKPKAARAVGGAMAANPLPIVIPCHRVIRSDGGLGGYSGGLNWKPQLLSLESQGASA